MSRKTTEIEKRIFAVLVDNEPGVLARVIGLFSGRGYNIESLTVSEVDVERHLSRITIITSGTPQVLDQIRAQLERLVPVRRVSDLTEIGDFVERELALIKVAGAGDKRVEALRIAGIFEAKVVDAGLDYFDPPYGEAGPLHRPDAAPGIDRRQPHRRGRHFPRAGGLVGRSSRWRVKSCRAAWEAADDQTAGDAHGQSGIPHRWRQLYLAPPLRCGAIYLSVCRGPGRHAAAPCNRRKSCLGSC
jgi:acetolactate synthase-1/3 small subunit